MGVLLRTFLLFLLPWFASSLLAEEYCAKVVLKTFYDQNRADQEAYRLKERLANVPLARLLEDAGVEISARASGRYYILAIESFTDRKLLLKTLKAVRHWYPDAFANRNDPQRCAPLNQEEEATRSQASSATEEIKAAESAPKKPESNATTPVTEAEPSGAEQPRLEPQNAQAAATAKSPAVQPAAPQKPVSDAPPPKPAPKPETAVRTAPPPTNTQTAAKHEPAAAPAPRSEEEQTSKTLFAGLRLDRNLIDLGLIGLLLLFWYRSRNNDKEIDEYKKLAEEKEEDAAVCKIRLKNQQVFLAKVVHELRSPINAILGLSDLLENEKLPPESRNHVNQIRQSGELMLNFIDDLIDFTKISQGKFTVNNIEFNLNEVLGKVRSIMSTQASNKGIDLAFDIDPDVPLEYVGDPLRLEQVLINLIGNGIKFTEKGGVELKISAQRGTDPKRVQLTFVVKDTGIGMKPQDLDKLFTNFYQANTSIKRIISGTGLGLSIVKQIVEAMGGKIQVESKWGEGSTFTVTIPMELGRKEGRRHYHLPSKAYMHKRVVIVDTHPRSAAALRKMLQYFRYEVISEPSLEKAMDQATKQKVDLLFIDENYLGRQTIELIEAIQHNWPTKVVLVESVHNQSRNRQLIPSVRYFLVRPFTQKEVFDLLLKIFNR